MYYRRRESNQEENKNTSKHHTPYKNEPTLENVYYKDEDKINKNIEPVISRKVDLPGAAVVSRNVISYEKKPKLKTTRVSSGKLSDSDNSYAKTTNAAITKAVTVKTNVTTRIGNNHDSK